MASKWTEDIKELGPAETETRPLMKSPLENPWEPLPFPNPLCSLLMFNIGATKSKAQWGRKMLGQQLMQVWGVDGGKAAALWGGSWGGWYSLLVAWDACAMLKQQERMQSTTRSRKLQKNLELPLRRDLAAALQSFVPLTWSMPQNRPSVPNIAPTQFSLL